MKDKVSKKIKSRTPLWLFFVGVGLMIVIIVAIVVLIPLALFSNDKIMVSGEFSEPENTRSMTCENASEVLSILDTRDTIRTTTRVTGIFSDKTLDSISVVYSLFNRDADKINSFETLNHAAINLDSQVAGFGPDVFNLHFSKPTDRLEIRMYAKAEDLTPASLKYFMLNNLTTGPNLTESAIKQAYVRQGFSCTTKGD